MFNIFLLTYLYHFIIYYSIIKASSLLILIYLFIIFIFIPASGFSILNYYFTLIISHFLFLPYSNT